MYVRQQLPPYLGQISYQPDLNFIHTIISANHSHQAVTHDGYLFHNKNIAALARNQYTVDDLQQIKSALQPHGTLDLPIITQHSVTLREGKRTVSLLPATQPGANHGDMSNMVYLRDQIQTADALLQLAWYDHDHRGDDITGKQLLVSSLDLLSTPAQLHRFADCIDQYVSGKDCTQSDWPQISLQFDNLDGTNPNNWRNIQDSIQMLAYTTLTALERGQIQPADLLPSHKQMLGAIIALIVSAGSPLYENSGSWEEITARRTSVMAIETAVFSKLFDLRLSTDGRRYAFFASEYQKYRHKYPDFFAADLDELLMAKTIEGLTAISERLPFESPKYSKNTVKFRTADSALVYVLRYHIPELLVRYGIDVMAINQPLSGHDREEQIEDLILDQLQTLVDPEGYGMFRYHSDSYQRVNWGTNETQAIVKNIKRFVTDDAATHNSQIDLDLKQSLRHQLMPKGRQAAWSLGQAHIAFWAADRYRQHIRLAQPDRAARYRAISTNNLNVVLSLITGDEQFTSTADNKGIYHVTPVVAWRLPECYVTYQADDKQAIVPSAHTPLYWSVALLKGTIGLFIE